MNHSETTVPFNKPPFLPSMSTHLSQVLHSNHWQGDGPISKQAEHLLTELLQAKTLLTTSATHALEMMAILAEIQPGDEVIIPSFTFVSTANAFALRGAKILFADNDWQGNITLKEIERLATPKTKAVVIVHYAGASPDMDPILQWGKAKGVFIFEDAAQCIGASYKNRPLGSLGQLGALSFHATKNITSGEGGALIVGNPSFLQNAEIVREKGTNRKMFLEGLIDKYTWVNLGSSYILSDLNASILLPQLENLQQIQKTRGVFWNNYKTALKKSYESMGISVLETPEYNTPSYHMFALIFQDHEQRSSFMRFMREHKIVCAPHYVPLHLSPYFLKIQNSSTAVLKNCEALSNRLIRLPLYYNFTESEQEHVINTALKWLKLY